MFGGGYLRVQNLRCVFPPFLEKELAMARGDGGSVGGIGIGGILVILGVVLAFVWSTWIGILIAVIGLVAFGGFAKGRWY